MLYLGGKSKAIYEQILYDRLYYLPCSSLSQMKNYGTICTVKACVIKTVVVTDQDRGFGRCDVVIAMFFI